MIAQEEHKAAAGKAMKLLLVQDRTEKELQNRLQRAGFSEAAVQYAVEYVRRFGYVDDLRYARNYIAFRKEGKSRKELRYKLLGKGVSEEVLAEAFRDYEGGEEEEAIRRQMRKKLKARSLLHMDYEEKNKLIAFLARKGFEISKIRSVLKEEEQI